ncbi:hypothetical protein ES708_22564 [subsurface metagenome]
MTIDEAIKIQTIHNDHNPDFTDAQRREAHQLGIEALKWVKEQRLSLYFGDAPLLPGEDSQ